MFNKDANHSQQDTIISSSIKVEGELNATSDIIINGQVTGAVSTQGNLVVGEKAEITADIKATNARVAGKIKGNLQIDGRLELATTSKIHGDIVTKILVVAEGAQINGHCQMETTVKTEKIENLTPFSSKSNKKIV